MSRFVLTSGIVLCLVPAAFPWRAGAADDEATGFRKAQWTLNQLTRFEVRDDGQLRLKRDHWELAAKKPLPAPAAGSQDAPDNAVKGRVQFMREMMGVQRNRAQFGGEDPTPLEKLFERLSHETGGSGSNSLSTTNQAKRRSWTTPQLAGTLRTEEGDMQLDLNELGAGYRTVEVLDNDGTTKFLFRTPAADIVRILRRDGSVHVCSSINGAVTSLTGRSFAEIVQKNEDYFRNELQPFLDAISQLPIDEAMKATLQDSDDEMQFPPLTFGEGELTRDAVAAALAPLLRFQMTDGLLRLNRFYGNVDVLEKEIDNLREEFTRAMDQTKERLRALDVPEAQINELEAKMGQWKQAVPPANPIDRLRARAARAGALRLGGFPGQEEIPEPELRAFEVLQAAVGTGGSGSTRGGDNYSVHFRGGVLNASISRNTDTYAFSAEDQDAKISVRETSAVTELAVESDTGMLCVSQSGSGPCSVMLMGAGDFEAFRGESLADLVNKHENVYRERILPVLERYGVSGLDPFDEHVVSVILDRLQTQLSEKLKADNIVSRTDAYVIPLLNDAAYLKILSGRLEGNDRAVVKKRVEQLTQ